MTYPKNIKAAEESEISADAVVKYLSDYDASRLNALKHGLTAKLDPASVLQWYRIILDDPGAELPLLIEPDLAQRAWCQICRDEFTVNSKTRYGFEHSLEGTRAP